jgi:hypothetical protein
MGMTVTVFLNIEENLRTSLMLRSTYLTRPSSLRFDMEQCNMMLPGGRANSPRMLQKLLPISFRDPPSTLMTRDILTQKTA